MHLPTSKMAQTFKISEIEGLPDIPETTKARINLALTTSDIEHQKIGLWVNHDAGLEEREQRQARLERLQNLQKLQ